MYGWRGRIGVIIPADNAVMEPDFHRLAPEGVSTHAARLQKCPRPDMPVKALDLVKTLVETHVDIVAYMCAASSFVLGPEENEDLCSKLSKATGGLPALTATTAMIEGLRAVGAHRVTVVAPHPPEIVEKLKEYIERSGFAVSSAAALGLDLAAINNTSPGEIYRIVRGLDVSDADAIFIAATNFRSIDVIEAIEVDTGLPVITSNQVVMWSALRRLGIAENPPGYGRLWDCETPAPIAH